MSSRSDCKAHGLVRWKAVVRVTVEWFNCLDGFYVILPTFYERDASNWYFKDVAMKCGISFKIITIRTFTISSLLSLTSRRPKRCYQNFFKARIQIEPIFWNWPKDIKRIFRWVLNICCWLLKVYLWQSERYEWTNKIISRSMIPISVLRLHSMDNDNIFYGTVVGVD